MTLTMIIGSFIGGATSEGGGAMAFPVMTLALALEPGVARDFVYLSQSAGRFLIGLIFLGSKSMSNVWASTSLQLAPSSNDDFCWCLIFYKSNNYELL